MAQIKLSMLQFPIIWSTEQALSLCDSVGASLNLQILTIFRKGRPEWTGYVVHSVIFSVLTEQGVQSFRSNGDMTHDTFCLRGEF